MQKDLPVYLYTSEQTRLLDRLAIEDFLVGGFELMRRAGESVYQYLRDQWPELEQNVLQIFCGAGNNAGDGYITAALALQAGLQVRVVALKNPDTLGGDALKAWGLFEDLGGQVELWGPGIKISGAVVVDALLGTGLQGEVDNRYAAAIRLINSASIPTVSVDIPSGLSGDTGENCGAVINADVTLCFIGLKQGMLTAEGVDHCGKIIFSDLSIPEEIYRTVPNPVRRINQSFLLSEIKVRPNSSHKGQQGHLVVAGGNVTMAGAAIMTTRAALRAGAGLVTTITHPDNVQCVHAACPEAIVCSAENSDQLSALLNDADAIALGPGLGRDDWGLMMLEQIWQQSKPVLLDADVLNILANLQIRQHPWLKNQNAKLVMTPHPGEAARLLKTTAAEVQRNRFKASVDLSKNWNAVMVLKGAGTLVRFNQQTWLCSEGNPGMAVAGMGDILSGVIGALLAQQYEPFIAAILGVWLHAKAADECVLENGVVGLMATDLPDRIRAQINALVQAKIEN